MTAWFRFCLLSLTLLGVSSHAQAANTDPIPFVMQMTVGDSDAQRRAFLQIQKVLHDIGPEKVKIVVVAYGPGITSLLSDNGETASLVADLSRKGVDFKACRISMRSYGFPDDDFPMTVGFVPAGAPEMIRLQMHGYKYWRP